MREEEERNLFFERMFSPKMSSYYSSHSLVFSLFSHNFSIWSLFWFMTSGLGNILFPVPCINDLPFSHCLEAHVYHLQYFTNIWVCFQVFYSIPLFCLFLSQCHSMQYSSFTTCVAQDSANYSIFFLNFLAIFTLFFFLIQDNFIINTINTQIKTSHGDFGIVIISL